MQGKGRTEQREIVEPGNRFYLLIGFLVISIDQATKWLVYFLMDEGESIRVIGNFFRFTFIYNPRGAFGFGSSAGHLYIFLSIIAIIVIVYYFQKSRRVEKILRLNLSVILGGAFGNIIDRITHGKVVDFIDVEFFNINIEAFSIFGIRLPGYNIDRWPIFNIADCAVSIGTLGVIIYIILHPESSKKIAEETESTLNSPPE